MSDNDQIFICRREDVGTRMINRPENIEANSSPSLSGSTDCSPCDFCGAPTVALCDWMIGWSIGEWHPCSPRYAHEQKRLHEYDYEKRALPMRTEDSVMHTCDARMCENCKKQVGMITLDGVDSIDHCPHHLGTEECFRLVTDEQVEKERAIARRAKPSTPIKLSVVW